MAIAFPKIESPAMKYGYSNARVKGMKGLLLTRQFYDELISTKRMEAIAELLQRTHYKDDVNYYSVRYRDSALVELAAIRHFARVARKMKKIAPRGDAAAIDALLKKWDLLNLKMIINAKRAGKKFEEIRPYLIETGAVDEEDYEAIARADETTLFDTIKKTAIGSEMLSLSTASFNKEMWSVFKSALTNMDTFLQLQAILDTYIYLFMDKGLKSAEGKDLDIVRKMLRKEIDAKNILLIERLKAHGIDAKKIDNYLIRGGTLSRVFIDQLVAATGLKDVVALLKTRFPDLEFTKEGDEAASLVELEIALEKAIAHEKVRTFHKAVLSIGVVLGFLLLKEEEINNLRKIARAKEFGVSEQDTKDMIIVV